MAGLLYKDFIAVKGRLYLAGMAAGLLVVLAMELLTVAGAPENTAYLAWGLATLLILCLYMLLVGNLEVSVMAVEAGRKQKEYYLSLPVSPRQYVASKYLFILLAYYGVLSFSVFLQAVCQIYCSNTFLQIIYSMQSMLPLMTCLLLFIPSVELPFFICFGVKKGNRIKTGLVVFLFFAIFVYVMFGDLSIFDKINMESIVKYLQSHRGLLLGLQVGLPFCALGVFYVSYRISCRLFVRKEWEDD